ncbi:MAG: hypothetical protein MUO51_06655, partial [Woeseiaceae bacterium]|nr:hypothetical protein [Woeseiaceae bacterium]
MKGSKALLALYVTLLSGCGGGGSSGMVTGPPPPASTPTITTQRVFGNLSFIQPVALLQAPGDSTRWFVAEKGGFIRVFA